MPYYKFILVYKFMLVKGVQNGMWLAYILAMRSA